MTTQPLRLAALISGSGSTLQNLLDCRDRGQLDILVPLAIADRDCTGIQRAEARGVPVVLLSRKRLSAEEFSSQVFSRLRNEPVELVGLAGFLSQLIIPPDFENRVMNIHPALIPAFCGAGMYGQRVHQAVLDRGCRITGCTVHFADNEYDHGPILVQKCVPVLPDDTAKTLSARVFEAECIAYPEAIRDFASRLHRSAAAR